MLAKSLATEYVPFSPSHIPITHPSIPPNPNNNNNNTNRWAPHNIRVNSLSPGYIATDLIKDLLNKQGTDLSQLWVKDIPLGRMAHPAEFQGTVVWMVSDAASYLTGSDIVCYSSLLFMGCLGIWLMGGDGWIGCGWGIYCFLGLCLLVFL